MKNIKRIISLLLVFTTMMSLFSCSEPGGDENNTNQGGAEPKPKEYLVEGEDYIDIASTYDGKTFEYDNTLWYMNNLKDVPLPDPFVFAEDDTYYIVGTSDRNINVVDCYVTTDFVNYEVYEGIYDPSQYEGWEGENPEVYAPEIYLFDGVYYMYYSANDKDNIRRCSVVVANNPLGPYKPLVNKEVDGLNNPLFVNPKDTKTRALDTTIFTDDDGKMYMYYTVTNKIRNMTNNTQYIVGVELIKPYLPDWSTYKPLVIPGTVDSESEEILLEWETYRDNKVKIAEAPFMIKSGGKYYLTYSVNGCWNKYYNVCYAVSDSPLGKFVKPYEEGKLWTNLFMGYPGTNDSESTIFNQWIGYSSGTGHHSFFYAGDELMISYHAHKNRNWDSKQFTERYFAIDYVHIDENGKPFCNGPTYSLVNLPSSISTYHNILNDATITATNVQNPEKAIDNYVINCYNLDDKNNEVMLGEGESTIELTFDQTYEIKGILVYNSSYYEDYIIEIDYIDFGNGNVIRYPQFCEDFYVNDETEFIRPLSTINLEILNTFEADSVKIGFNLPEGGSINEIVILGR